MMTFLIPIVEDIWNLKSIWGSMVPIIYWVGVMFGSVFWAKVADVQGRRKAIICGVILTAIATTATVFVTGIYALLICRFCSGLGYMHQVLLTLISEYAPVAGRSKS